MTSAVPGPPVADALLDALALPARARVDQRVPKKLLVEHGTPTAADRRLVQDGVDALVWVAVLKPATVGLPAYRDEVRDYAEVSVLTATLRPAVRPAQAARLAELVHRAVPYPVVLLLAQGAAATFSLAHKRRPAAGGEGAVAELPGAAATLGAAPHDDPAERAFLAALPLGTQPAAHLFAAYQGWMDRVPALDAARVTGRWAVPATPTEAARRRGALDEYARLRREAVALRAAAGRERQLARRVELNLQLRRLDAQLGALTEAL